MAHSQSESSILYHVVQMDQSESRKKNLHKKDVKATQKSAKKNNHRSQVQICLFTLILRLQARTCESPSAYSPLNFVWIELTMYLFLKVQRGASCDTREVKTIGRKTLREREKRTTTEVKFKLFISLIPTLHARTCE